MDDVFGACPSKNSKPLFPATLSRFWNEVVAENEPAWLLNKPDVTELEAVRLATLVVPENDGLAVGALASRAACKPEVLAMLQRRVRTGESASASERSAQDTACGGDGEECGQRSVLEREGVVLRLEGVRLKHVRC